jgi:hypothetical protein
LTHNETHKSGFDGLLPSLAVTEDEQVKSEKSPMEIGLKSLSVTVGHELSKTEKWCPRQDLNLYDVTH